MLKKRGIGLRTAKAQSRGEKNTTVKTFAPLRLDGSF
jgi:hypothetical protein